MLVILNELKVPNRNVAITFFKFRFTYIYLLKTFMKMAKLNCTKAISIAQDLLMLMQWHLQEH